MATINSIYKMHPFSKTIQLYGDRSGGQGNFEFAGFAELQDVKLVVLKGNDESLEQPSDWRRLVRLILLAQRIEKPVLLWNLPLSKKANDENPTLLPLGTAIQNAKMQLLKLQQPIIKVFDEMYNCNDTFLELGLGDGMVVVISEEDEKLKKKLKQVNLKTVRKQADITEQILNLLHALTKNSGTELVSNRIQSYSLTNRVI